MYKLVGSNNVVQSAAPGWTRPIIEIRNIGEPIKRPSRRINRTETKLGSVNVILKETNEVKASSFKGRSVFNADATNYLSTFLC